MRTALLRGHAFAVTVTHDGRVTNKVKREGQGRGHLPARPAERSAERLPLSSRASRATRALKSAPGRQPARSPVWRDGILEMAGALAALAALAARRDGPTETTLHVSRPSRGWHFGGLGRAVTWEARRRPLGNEGADFSPSVLWRGGRGRGRGSTLESD